MLLYKKQYWYVTNNQKIKKTNIPFNVDARAKQYKQVNKAK